MKLPRITLRPPFGRQGIAALLLLSLLTVGLLYVYKQGPDAAAEVQSAQTTDHTAQPQSFTIIALPDTQKYTARYPHIFEAQTDWIVKNAKDLNIAFVTHLGDVVDDALDRQQWQAARRALSKLDGIVPYAIATGNHDMEKNGAAFYLNHYFPAEKFERQSWWGGSHQTEQTDLPIDQRNGIKNSYQLFSAGGREYLFLHLEYCPPDEVLRWADSVIQGHNDRQVFLSSHAFMNGYQERRDSHYPKCTYHVEGANDGEDIWQKLIIKNSKNVKLAMGGHYSNETGGARRVDQVGGNRIHQLFSNYQQQKNGGNGYLRIMQFDPVYNTAKVRTYSPYLDSYLEDESNNFTLKL